MEKTGGGGTSSRLCPSPGLWARMGLEEGVAPKTLQSVRGLFVSFLSFTDFGLMFRSAICRPGFTVDSGLISDADVGSWPYSTSILVKCTAFLSTLRWPEGLNEVDKYGVSSLEVLVLFEKWILKHRA